MGSATSRVIAERYLRFAQTQAAGSSATFETWARGFAEDAELLAFVAPLPRIKQQPNLVFAAARWHGATPGSLRSLRATLLDGGDAVRATIMARSTQTNEPARGAILAWGLSRLRGPLALLEVGASAGLVLGFDRYSYRFPDGYTLHPAHGPSRVAIDIPSSFPRAMPEVAWRAGLDLNPLDPGDADTRAWLTNLVWPEHHERRERLEAALEMAAASDIQVHRGDLLTNLSDLAASAPADATLVIAHSAVLAYLPPERRDEAVTQMRSLGHWLSFEAPGIAPGVIPPPDAAAGSFTAALDGVPFATATGHASGLQALE